MLFRGTLVTAKIRYVRNKMLGACCNKKNQHPKNVSRIAAHPKVFKSLYNYFLMNTSLNVLMIELFIVTFTSVAINNPFTSSNLIGQKYK